MATRYWKLEKAGELPPQEAAVTVGNSGHTVLRTEISQGKTTIYFSGEGDDEHAKAFRAKATEIKVAEVTKT